MSKLDELIKELCPNGVEFKTLGEVCEIKTGYKPEKVYKEKHSYEYINAGTTNSGFTDIYNCDGDTVTTPSRGQGGIGFVGYQKNNFFLGPLCYKIQSLDKTIILAKYIFYYLQNNNDIIFKIKNEGGVPSVNRVDLIKLEVAIPPLPVQEEIVRILDSFTELTTELTAELTARKKQYEYYRDSLISDSTDIIMKRLGDTCSMKSGKAIRAVLLSDVKDEKHPYPCFGGNGIRGYIAEQSHQGNYPIIGRQGALCGNVNYAMGTFYATEHAVVVESLGEYEQRYLFYLLTAINLNQYKSQGAQPGLAVGNIENLIAPVPSLEQQRKVIKILDRFDTLCNDISSGLPAEIKARQQQYEYYRDKLLTFKKKEA